MLETMKQLKQCNIIEVQEDIKEVQDFMVSLGEETVKIYLPLDEFCIKYNDIGYINLGQNVDSYFYVKKYKNKWHIEHYLNSTEEKHKNKLILTVSFNVLSNPNYNTKDSDIESIVVKVIKSNLDEEITNAITNMFVILLGYIIYIKDNPTIEYEKETENNNKGIVKNNISNSNNKKKDYKITLGNKVIKLKLQPNEIRTFKRKYVRTVDTWEVIGHIRHYKNGKTIFIKPYIKGKNRGEVNKKDYVIKSKINKK